MEAFDGQRAYRHVERLVGFGPRPSGSEALKESAGYIAGQLREYGLTVEDQEFHALAPSGPMKFHNVVGRTRQQGRGPARFIVIGSHYDTKRMPGIRFVGANDGGSSAGVLLEMARVAAARPNLVFVFFDGEEAQVEYGRDDGLWGSKFFVEFLKSEDRVPSIRAMILLDMVGDANLKITIPPNSSGELAQVTFDAARALGYRDSFGYRMQQILDDHVPFLQAGIPAIDLIDFEYGSAPGRNDYWHTDQDTLDKISPHSLEIVGRTALRLVGGLQASRP